MCSIQLYPYESQNEAQPCELDCTWKIKNMLAQYSEN